jgi:hypothetical protein
VDEHLQLRLTPSSSPLSAAFCFLDCLVDTISYYNYYVEKQKKVKVTKKKPEKKRREEISCADMHAPSENKEHTHTYILEVSKIAVRPLECETLVCVRVCVGGGGGGGVHLCVCAHEEHHCSSCRDVFSKRYRSTSHSLFFLPSILRPYKRSPPTHPFFFKRCER